MRVIHFTQGSVDPDSSNGINRVIEGLAGTMNAVGSAEVSVITVRQKMKQRGREVFSRNGFSVTACHSTAEALRLFVELRNAIDLVHLHNAWSIPNIRLGAWLANQKIPYVLTPHAAFLPDRMLSKPWIKKLFHETLQRRMLDQASALIAVSRDEMASIAQFTTSDKIFYLPNGAPDVDWRRFRERSQPSSKVVFGYLGRIKREKNILSLVRAVSLLPQEVRSAMIIRIFGDYSSAYGQKCIQLSKTSGLVESVQFCGSISAKEKWSFLGALDAYVQPSLSEAASIAVLEAISMGLPLVATRTSGVSYWYGQSFLTMVEPIASDIARGLEIFVRDRDSLYERGVAGRTYFEKYLLWPAVSSELLSIYRHCLREEKK